MIHDFQSNSAKALVAVDLTVNEIGDPFPVVVSSQSVRNELLRLRERPHLGQNGDLLCDWIGVGPLLGRRGPRRPTEAHGGPRRPTRERPLRLDYRVHQAAKSTNVKSTARSYKNLFHLRTLETGKDSHRYTAAPRFPIVLAKDRGVLHPSCRLPRWGSLMQTSLD